MGGVSDQNPFVLSGAGSQSLACCDVRVIVGVPRNQQVPVLQAETRTSIQRKNGVVLLDGIHSVVRAVRPPTGGSKDDASIAGEGRGTLRTRILLPWTTISGVSASWGKRFGIARC
jgi:hypothetical protein